MTDILNVVLSMTKVVFKSNTHLTHYQFSTDPQKEGN